MDLKGKRVILGSNSPRRRELLAGLNIDFEVDTRNDFDERFSPDTPYDEVPGLMSIGKSHGFHRPLEADEVLITSDTVVIVDREVLGKPHSREEAVEMLHKLSGRAHEVVTAVTIRDCAREETFSVSTQVHFEALTEAEIDHYIDKYKPYDKAGAYGIQEWIGYVGISSIEGSFYNVMGFPVHRVWHALQRFL